MLKLPKIICPWIDTKCEDLDQKQNYSQSLEKPVTETQDEMTFVHFMDIMATT